VGAVMAGASSVAAITHWPHDLDDIARARLDARERTGILRAAMWAATA